MKSVPFSQFLQSDGKTVILPLDHGAVIPVPGMESPGDIIAAVSDHVDGFVANLGFAIAFKDAMEGKGVCLRTDVYKPDNLDGSYKTYGAEEAEVVGATAMMHMLYPGHDNETSITIECAATIAEGLEAGIPVIVEALPVGLGLPDAYTAENVSFAVRQAAELGAGIVKTAYPTGATVDEFRAIIEACFVPVIVLGGAAMGDDRALLSMVRNAMDAGAVGIAVGRNVWQHEDPARIARQLAAIVHGDATVDEALGA